jgi:hypothetical protein
MAGLSTQLASELPCSRQMGKSTHLSLKCKCHASSLVLQGSLCILTQKIAKSIPVLLLRDRQVLLYNTKKVSAREAMTMAGTLASKTKDMHKHTYDTRTQGSLVCSLCCPVAFFCFLSLCQHTHTHTHTCTRKNTHTHTSTRAYIPAYTHIHSQGGPASCPCPVALFCPPPLWQYPVLSGSPRHRPWAWVAASLPAGQLQVC